MNLWIVNHYASPPGGRGGPTRHLGLSRALRDRGHDVTILASTFDHYERRQRRDLGSERFRVEFIDGIRYIWIPGPPYSTTVGRVLNMVSFARRLIMSAGGIPGPDPDVVVGSSPHLLAPLAALAIARRRSIAFVLEIRDLWPQSLVDLGELSKRHPAVVALAAIERYLYRTADELITVLPNATKHFLANGARADRLHVIPNGVEPRGSTVKRSSATEPFTAIYAGTMGLANGLDLLVDAAELLSARDRQDIRVRLVGAGPDWERLRHRAEGIACLSVEPAVPADEVPELLAASDVGLLVLRDSSVFRWGVSPTKLFEYLAAGLPVISSVRAPNDIAADCGAGIAADPGNPGSLAAAIEAMANLSPEDRVTMGERGRRFVEARHTFGALAEAFEQVAGSAAHRAGKETRR